MHLKTNVKLGEVNNLSDARFGAGIGAKFLGFNFSPDSHQFLDPEKYKEIAGWLQGPCMVGEWNGESPEYIRELTEELALEYIQLNHFDPACTRELKGYGIIQNIYLDGCHTISEIISRVDQVQSCVKYFMLSFENADTQLTFLERHANHVLLTEFCRDFPVIFNFQFTGENMLPLIEKYRPFGINLRGSNEIKPGFKDFDELNALIEQLEL